jgi:hypothetical protein
MADVDELYSLKILARVCLLKNRTVFPFCLVPMNTTKRYRASTTASLVGTRPADHDSSDVAETAAEAIAPAAPIIVDSSDVRDTPKSLKRVNHADDGCVVIVSNPQSPPRSATVTAPNTPPFAGSGAALVPNPQSPACNRDRFRGAMMPAQVTCDLSTVSTEAGLRFTFQGVVLVVYPSASNPVRRHVLVGDGRGTVGITVWNAHVNSFSMSSVGQLVVVTKVSMILHNGTRGISMNKESTVSFNTLADHFAAIWWNAIPHQSAVSAVLFNDQRDNTVVNVAGILGSVTVEQRTVRCDARELLTIRLVDRTGIIAIRSWNHSLALFQHLVDRPVLIKRVRVTSFATTKTGELFDGSGTTIVSDDFPGACDLAKFWTE